MNNFYFYFFFRMKNVTDLDTQQFWAEVEHDEIIKRIPVAIVVGLFSVVGIMGNFHILIVFSRNLNNFSTYHVMVSALAVSDLFVCATYLPVEITMVMKPLSFDFDLTCRLSLLNSYIWGIWSAFLTVLIAVERYRRICYPVRAQISCSTARKFCLVLFLIAMFNAAPIGYIAGTHTIALSNDTDGYECFVSDDLTESYIPTGYFFFLLFEVLVLGFAIVLLYLPIRRAIQRSNTLRKHHAKISKSETTQVSQEKTEESIFRLPKSFKYTENYDIPQINIQDADKADISDAASFQNIMKMAPNKSTKKSSSEQFDNKSPNTLKVSLSVSSVCSLDYSKPQATRSLSSKPLCSTRRLMINNAVTKVTIGLFLISIIFFVTLITFLVLTLLRILAEETLSGMSVTEAYIFLFGFELGYLNHVVNCFIYFYSDRRFRKEVQTIYSCRSRK